MEKIIKRNYEAVVKRGLITPDTKDKDFLLKLEEETEECVDAYFHRTEEDLFNEIGDVITVCCNWLYHKGVDIEILLEQIARKNEGRSL